MSFLHCSGSSLECLSEKSGVCLELLCDIDQLNFIERGLRGGISQISHRYQLANNPLLGEEHYDPKKPTSYLQYLDMNNLYGFAMQYPLPTGFFRFLNEEEIKNIDILSIPADASTGYLLEVSLTYPKHLHGMGDGRVVRWCWVNFQYRGVLQLGLQ